MNHTKIHVPRIAVVNANIARPHSVDCGINKSARRIPNCADEIVAPVVGETNLFMQSCCIINPAVLIPTPVQMIASRRGSLEIKKISNCSIFPRNNSIGVTSITPTNKDTADRTRRSAARMIVDIRSFINFLLFKVSSN